MVDRQALGAFRRPAGARPAGEAGEEAVPAPAPTPAAPAPVPPPPEAAAAPSGAPVAAGPFPTRDQLVQAWGDHVIGRLRPKAKALFQAGRFVGVEGDRAVFGLPNEIHRDRCEEVRGEIEAALSEQFGRPVLLELVVDPGAEAPVPGAGPPPHRTTPGPGRPRRPGGRRRGSADRTDRPPAPRRPPEPPADRTAPDPPEGPADHHEPDDHEDLAAFDESELGEIAEVDNSAEARVLQAFPGAEEVV